MIDELIFNRFSLLWAKLLRPAKISGGHPILCRLAGLRIAGILTSRDTGHVAGGLS